MAFQTEFVRKSRSGLRSLGRGWEDMIQPGYDDPRSLRKSEWEQKMGMIECVIRCIIRWYKMRWVVVQDVIYRPRSLLSIYSSSRCPSLLPLNLRTPTSPSPSPSSLYPRTPAVAQSSAKLSGGGGCGGEKWIFPPQRSSGIICPTVSL